MRKIFLKEYRTKIDRYSVRYYIAVIVELIAIILWSIGLSEIYILGKCNPATMLVNIGGLFFTCGSFMYAKWVQH